MKMNRLVAALACLPLFALADEGMWTVDNFPADAAQEKYGVRIGDAWLDASRLATVRLENGCTGSCMRTRIVSRDRPNSHQERFHQERFHPFRKKGSADSVS